MLQGSHGGNAGQKDVPSAKDVILAIPTPVASFQKMELQLSL